VTNNTIGLLETTYGRASFSPHNHYDLLYKKRLIIVRLEIEYTLLLNTLI